MEAEVISTSNFSSLPADSLDSSSSSSWIFSSTTFSSLRKVDAS